MYLFCSCYPSKQSHGIKKFHTAFRDNCNVQIQRRSTMATYRTLFLAILLIPYLFSYNFVFAFMSHKKCSSIFTDQIF